VSPLSSQVNSSQAKPSQAKPSQAKPSQASKTPFAPAAAAAALASTPLKTPSIHPSIARASDGESSQPPPRPPEESKKQRNKHHHRRRRPPSCLALPRSFPFPPLPFDCPFCLLDANETNIQTTNKRTAEKQTEYYIPTSSTLAEPSNQTLLNRNASSSTSSPSTPPLTLTPVVTLWNNKIPLPSFLPPFLLALFIVVAEPTPPDRQKTKTSPCSIFFCRA